MRQHARNRSGPGFQCASADRRDRNIPVNIAAARMRYYAINHDRCIN
jgi:hypothetical protein